MLDVPSFDKLDRASEFTGAVANWVLGFKQQQQKNKMRAKLSQDIEHLNRLTNYKAQIIQTMTANLNHIQTNHKLLSTVNLWTRATTYQATGFRMAQKALNILPETIVTYAKKRLTSSIHRVKPHSKLLPASLS